MIINTVEPVRKPRISRRKTTNPSNELVSAMLAKAIRATDAPGAVPISSSALLQNILYGDWTMTIENVGTTIEGGNAGSTGVSSHDTGSVARRAGMLFSHLTGKGIGQNVLKAFEAVDFDATARKVTVRLKDDAVVVPLGGTFWAIESGKFSQFGGGAQRVFREGDSERERNENSSRRQLPYGWQPPVWQSSYR